MAGLQADPEARVSPHPSGMRKRNRSPLGADDLVSRVAAYHPGLNEARLRDAYEFARTHHGEQLRASGDPYYSHPVAVAELLVQVRLDEVTIIAGLLHDVVEDTEISLDEIRSRFGEDVADLVDGVTKLTQLEYRSEETKQAENFQKFILATVNDIRVLLVKLADRLHNMRTIHHLKPEKRKRISRETMDIYAPLARRVGLYHVASEMEDRAFEQLSPEARAVMVARLESLESENKYDLERIREDLAAIMDAAGVKCRIKGRRKTPYSIWRKLERKDISFRDVADIFAFRIIIEGDVADCYRVLGVVHTVWACLPDRFRDFISVPKQNGYRSLHTTVRASGNRRVELQIRTEEMDETAENGVAAHWRYKGKSYGLDLEKAREAGLDPEANLRAFADLIQHDGDPREYLEYAKLEMYRANVFTFTPKGRLIRLPKGAMPLDFAYEVHTAIGNTCRGARINGETRSLRTELQNGDVVEIIRGDDPVPPPGWEAMTVTAKARSALRRLTRERDARIFTRLGHDMLRKALRLADIDPVNVRLQQAAERSGFASADQLALAVGSGTYTTRDFLNTVFPGHEQEARDGDKLLLDDDHASELVAGKTLLPGVSLHLGQCCMPVPGDRIIGINEPGVGIVVHTISCGSLANFDDKPELWVDLEWTELAKTGAVAVARLRVRAANQKGVLAALCSAVAQANGNIVALSTGQRSGDYIDVVFDIEVEDLKRVTQILAALRSLAVVDKAVREQEPVRED